MRGFRPGDDAVCGTCGYSWTIRQHWVEDVAAKIKAAGNWPAIPKGGFGPALTPEIPASVKQWVECPLCAGPVRLGERTSQPVRTPPKAVDSVDLGKYKRVCPRCHGEISTCLFCDGSGFLGDDDAEQ